MNWKLPGVSIRGGATGLAPQVGFEPTTLRLTAGCSAVELLRNTVEQRVAEGVRPGRALSAAIGGCYPKD